LHCVTTNPITLSHTPALIFALALAFATARSLSVSLLLLLLLLLMLLPLLLILLGGQALLRYGELGNGAAELAVAELQALEALDVSTASAAASSAAGGRVPVEAAPDQAAAAAIATDTVPPPEPELFDYVEFTEFTEHGLAHGFQRVRQRRHEDELSALYDNDRPEGGHHPEGGRPGGGGISGAEGPGHESSSPAPTLLPTPVPSLQVFVIWKRTLALHVDLSNSILELKRLIEEKTSIPPHLCRLRLNGTEITDDQTVGGCNIENGSTLRLALRLLAGGKPKDSSPSKAADEEHEWVMDAAEVRNLFPDVGARVLLRSGPTPGQAGKPPGAPLVGVVVGWQPARGFETPAASARAGRGLWKVTWEAADWGAEWGKGKGESTGVAVRRAVYEGASQVGKWAAAEATCDWEW
jgi:hypothetical protein